MSIISQWLNDLARVKGISRKKFQPCKVSTSTQLLSRADLNQTLSGLGEVTGWLQETSRVITLRNQAVALEHTPLAAELCRDNEHWLLDYQAPGQWCLHHYRCVPCAAEDASHLGEHIKHRMVGSRNHESLTYWRLWESDMTDESSLAPVARIALLTGFEE